VVVPGVKEVWGKEVAADFFVTNLLAANLAASVKFVSICSDLQ